MTNSSSVGAVYNAYYTSANTFDHYADFGDRASSVG